MNVVSINGPVEDVNGKLKLRIPLVVGGHELIESSRGIGAVEGDFLVITIPEWLAKKLGVLSGTVVNVNNKDGRFNIEVCGENA